MVDAMNTTDAPKPSFRARIDRNTRKLILPVPVSGLARFAIKGIWRDFANEGPDPTVVILKARAKIAGLSKAEMEAKIDHILSLSSGEEVRAYIGQSL